MTQEQKAKAYDEVRDKIALRFGGNVAKEIFSQFEESEDEMIRKELIDYFSTSHATDTFRGIAWDRVVAWLEKKGESDETKAKVFLINNGYPIDTNGIFPTYEEMYNIIREGLKKQGEQEHTDKVAPKFKVGDWIVQKNLGIYKIVEVCETWYEVISYKDGIQYSIGFDKENDCHLWTIQDAKEGDVLASTDWVCIFKRMKPHYYNLFDSYCELLSCKDFGLGFDFNIQGFYPATKEQCDLLFSKMHEAGYKWDAEKKELKNRVQQHPQKWSKDDERKELKKINAIKAEHGKYYYCIKDYFSGGKKFSSKGDVVQALNGLPIIGLEDISEYFLPVNNVYNNVWSEEDRRMIESIIKHLERLKNYQTNTTNTEQCQNWVKSLEDRVQSQQKQEWSKDDEYKKNDAITAIDLIMTDSYKEIHPNLYKAFGEAKDWLKSLRPQNTWKPSNEHYELEEFAKIVRGNLTGISKAVQKLFEDKYLQLTGNKMYGGFKD